MQINTVEAFGPRQLSTVQFSPARLSPAESRALLATFPKPAQFSLDKVLDHIDEHLGLFVEHSTFCCLATSDGAGKHDVSPRGDPAGALLVLDPKTICIADRSGDRRIDSLHNIAANPRIGLLVFVPGCGDCVRIGGAAHLSTDPALLDRLAINGKPPNLAIVVTVETAYLHCAKAIKRAALWDTKQHVAPGTLPTFASIIAAQVALTRAEHTTLKDTDEGLGRNGTWQPEMAIMAQA